MTGYYKCRKERNGEDQFLAWGATDPLTADSCVSEPAEPVHFFFRDSEEEAISSLRSEMEGVYGKLDWIRQ